jgi:two-component system sensor histidine kinase KdpD
LLHFFFLPPLFTFYLADTQNWVALFAFLVTAVVASQLSASAKRRASEAMRLREEIERLYELSGALTVSLSNNIFRAILSDVAKCDRVPGTGVGLHIVKNIIQAHGGEVGVESQPGHGAEFFLTLPVASR